MNHLTQNELQEIADGGRASEENAAAELHLRLCQECTKRLAVLRLIERAIRSLPLEKAPPGLSRNVLKSLGIGEASSWLYTLVRNLAPLAALTCVLVVVSLVLGRPAVQAGGGVSGESAGWLIELAGRYAFLGMQALNNWAGTYLSFALARQSIGLTGFLLVFLAAIALLDRYVFMPRLRKRP